MRQSKAKPFIKWVGGKSQLIEQLEDLLPADFDKRANVTYVEPFIGGGAMLFYMLQRYRCIRRAVICDVNSDLITCYKTIKDKSLDLLQGLEDIQREYFALSDESARKSFFLNVREKYNQKNLSDVENTVFFIFLNRTCFNGLYRVNKSGKFNVPFGRYASPKICDERTILADSELLQRVEIIEGDFSSVLERADESCFFYFDPPYRPLSITSNFNDYSKESFNDNAQIRLKEFCDIISERGSQFILSNSDCASGENHDDFFDKLYSKYLIDRVLASRNINSVGSKRGKLPEIVVRNYSTLAKEKDIQYSLFNNIVAENGCDYRTEI